MCVFFVYLVCDDIVVVGFVFGVECFDCGKCGYYVIGFVELFF